MLEAVRVEDKPKLTGISFNIFALVGLLVILPIGTAFVTNLSNANGDPNESIIAPNLAQSSTYPIVPFVEWLDKGDNMTNAYLAKYGGQVSDYQYINDPTSGLYSQAVNNRMISTTGTLYINGEPFKIGNDNHAFIPYTNDYIGYSGNEFSFLVTRNLTDYIDYSQDLKSFQFLFIDWQTLYPCNSNVFQTLNFNGDITFISEVGTETYSNFDFSQKNSYFNQFDIPTGTQIAQEGCHIALDVDFDLNPFESIEFNEKFANYGNITIIIDLYDFDFDTDFNNLSISPLPFAGDGSFAFDMRVGYVDNVQTNFYLSGGTFILGGALWLLAISSTPYWNPVINTLGGKK
jgi:hypothetical protein